MCDSKSQANLRSFTVPGLLITISIAAITLRSVVQSLVESSERRRVFSLAKQAPGHVTHIFSETISHLILPYFRITTAKNWVHRLSLKPTACNLNSSNPMVLSPCNSVVSNGAAVLDSFSGRVSTGGLCHDPKFSDIIVPIISTDHAQLWDGNSIRTVYRPYFAYYRLS